MNQNNNTRFRVISILCFLYCLSPAILAQKQLLESAKQQQQIQPGETPQGLTTNEWTSIQQQINSAQYRAHPDKNGGFRASNVAQGWQIQYAADGTTTLTPRNNQDKPYHLRMKLTAIGYQTLQTLHKPQKISQHEFTVSYQWNDNLRERWINSEQQLEQWFDIARRPEGASKGLPLIVQMTLDSKLKIIQNGENIQFSNSKGIDITYNKLKVWDSTGRELPARMHLGSNSLNLLVDESTAVYPLTIDPSIYQQAYIKASNTGPFDRFGTSVAISGHTLVVGAEFEDSSSTEVNGDQTDNSLENAGAVYVFTRSGVTWTQQAYLKASNSDAGDKFGHSVAIFGNTLVVGAYLEDSNSTGVNGDQNDNSIADAGAVYVFTRTGGTWSQQAYLKASNANAGDQFGASVAIAGDTLVVGANKEDSSSTGPNGKQSDNSEEDAGAVYIFTRNGITWTQQAYLKASNAGQSDQFGTSVALYGDTLVVGAPFERSNSTGVNGDQSYTRNADFTSHGAAYVFIRSNAMWSQQAYVKASNKGGRFGFSVAVFENTLVVGAPFEDNNSQGVFVDERPRAASSINSGAVFVFTRSDSIWTQQTYLSFSRFNEQFGISVAVFGDTLLAGAILAEFGNYSGDAIVYNRNELIWTRQDYSNVIRSDYDDQLGNSVAIFGSTLVVGAFLDNSGSLGINGDLDDDSAWGAGAAYVFDLDDPLVPIARDDGSTTASAYTTGVDQQLIVLNGLDDLVERNDSVGFPRAEVTSFDITSVQGGDVSVNRDGSFSYTPAADFKGLDHFTYTLKNSEGSNSATVYIRVDHTNLWVPVVTGSDDAEEDVSDGNIRLSSSDLELVQDDDLAIKQLVGVRFQGLGIPPRATIIEAYIQYTADEKDSEPTNLTVYGEASANAMTFRNTRFDISNRMLTLSQVPWSPEAWNTHEQSSRTQTPDLSAIVQEIVDQDQWLKGNSIAFITTGSGKRVAKSFNGTISPIAPAKLHVTFSNKPSDDEVSYVIGDTGPGGGIVFHTMNGGLNGLEVAPVNQGQALWGCFAETNPPAIITAASGMVVGTGPQNTADILAACPESGIAAEIADLYELNGVSDWFLPSVDEALLMYEQRDLLGLTANFWTSTENSAYSSFYLRLSQGDTRTGNKNVSFDVWPIRAF